MTNGLPLAEHGDQAALPATIRVGGSDLPIWPQGQAVEPLSAPLMAATRFADFATLHPELIDAVLTAERDPRWRAVLVLDTGGASKAPVFRGGRGTQKRQNSHRPRGGGSPAPARAPMLAHPILS